MSRKESLLIGSTSVAKRIEHAEAQVIAMASAPARQRDGSGFATPLCGGIACFAGAASPMNKVAGLGFGGTPESAVMDDIENEFAIRGLPTQVELSSLADPEIGAMLAQRGYRLVSFENVLGRRLDPDLQPATPPGIEVDLCGADDFDAWVRAVVDGSVHPDDDGVPFYEQFSAEVIEREERDFQNAGATMYVGRCEGVVAAGASMVFTDGVAQFTGAATAPAYRRRGLQTALLARRLADAAAGGCDVAVITTAPGSKSQENAQRRGFHLLYTRAVLVKAVEGADMSV